MPSKHMGCAALWGAVVPSWSDGTGDAVPESLSQQCVPCTALCARGKMAGWSWRCNIKRWLYSLGISSIPSSYKMHLWLSLWLLWILIIMNLSLTWDSCIVTCSVKVPHSLTRAAPTNIYQAEDLFGFIQLENVFLEDTLYSRWASVGTLPKTGVH